MRIIQHRSTTLHGCMFRFTIQAISEIVIEISQTRVNAGYYEKQFAFHLEL